MSTLRIRVLSFAALVVLVGSCALAQTTSQSPNPSTEGKRSGGDVSLRAGDIEQERRWREREVSASEDVRDFTKALTVLAIVQAFITGAALVWTAIAANAARDSATVARDALHITERADVAIDRIAAETIGGELIADTEVIVVFHNRGRTRAKQVLFEGTLGVPGHPLIPKQMAPPVVLAAGEQRQFGFKANLGSHIPVTALAMINLGHMTLRITGRLRYIDVFDKPHTVEFEGVWNTQRGAFGTTRYEETD